MSAKANRETQGIQQSGSRLRWLAYLFLGLMCIVQLLPFWLSLCASSKPADDLSSTLIMRFKDFQWSNFADAISEGGILRSVLNSAIVTLCSTVLVCLLGAAAAYPLARRQTKGNKLVSGGVLSLMMIPPLSTLVPLYTMMVDLRGLNTYWGIVLVTVAGNLPLSIFLYTAFIKAIPQSIDEAGMIDGANRFTIFFRLILPLLKPVTATVVIMTSVGVWNEYAMSNYLITDPNKQLIAPRVASFFAMQSSNLGVGAAAALIAAVPIVVVYLFLQRYFIAGMVAGVEK
ncbi:carbohydrate ABC transporter permease [Bifidobacterium pullorum]|mgnify:CR=1 FL=1|uniref:Carbohydrate ABC transporter permease n=1 Tax=Bifidobacterium pullorum subsp. gallinarum TaxID=78344 RepID=A0A921IVZ0_9BIFI|nr:carbohydrate ABC transporter permease [Bifidobacterium pullorum]HJG40919.1 carbohydrate ABC transporter permease [Bifidobacterium pullorum subsp. gallinarum]